MRTLLSIAVLTFCLCASSVFAQGTLTVARNTTMAAATLDANTSDTGPIGAIVNAINKLDAWIQRNLW